MEPENVVYIVTRLDWDSEEIYAVFSNITSAQRFIDGYAVEGEDPDTFRIRCWEVND